jgi:hypothetical protein
MFENRGLRRIFWPKRDEVTGEWRKLHNEELQPAVASHVNFRCIYFPLKMVVGPKHVEDNFSKIVNNY